MIENPILESIYGKAITHPSLITEVCLLAGMEISKQKEKSPPMVPLPFSKKKKAYPKKPTIETPIERNQEENVEEGEPEDSKSEEEDKADEAELSQTTMERLSKLVSDVAKVQYEEYMDYR